MSGQKRVSGPLIPLVGVSSTRNVSALMQSERPYVAGLRARLSSLLAIVIIASFAHQWLHPDRSKELHEWMNLVFSPLVALVGAATGFYFGAQSAKKEED